MSARESPAGAITRGMIVIGALVVVHATAAEVVRRGGPGFAPLSHVPSDTLAAEAGFVPPDVATTGVSGTVRYPPMMGTVPGGAWTTATFAVERAASPSEPVRFFLSGDQRRQQAVTVPDWHDLPVRFVVLLDDREIVAGSLQRLAEPLYLREAVEEGALDGPLRFTVLLRSVAAWRPGDYPYPPAVAIEYVH